MTYDVVIIGAGLGGLECAYILAKHGMNVCVLEQGTQMGGCLQSFKRRGIHFDAGFHYVGGLDEGRPLNRLFDYFGLLDLPWQKMDEQCFDEVVIGHEHYRFAQGHEAWQAALAEQFPDQKNNLKKYDEAQANVGAHLFDALGSRTADDFYNNEAFTTPAYQVLAGTIGDERLRNVISGTSLKMELRPESLPFYVFAQINNSFIEGAYRLAGGGETLTNRMCENLRKMGITLVTKAQVTQLEGKAGKISAALCSNGERYEGRIFISNAHPATTLSLVSEEVGLRKPYKKRIDRMENTYGMFTANIAIKPETLPYQNKNLYLYEEGADIWNISSPECPKGLLVSYGCTTPDQKYASSIDLLCPMQMEELSEWKDTKIGHRGSDYEAFKAAKTEQCLRIAEKQIPGLREATDRIYTSTPLTYRDYTGTRDGSAYGLRKDANNTLLTFLPPKTPVENLLLTGQNLNLHGILGVSMTSFVTCSALIGMEAATDGLKTK